VAGQAEELGLGAKGFVAAFVPDLRGVLAVGGLPLEIARQHGLRVLDAELRRHVAHGALRHVGGIGEEGAQEPDGGELEGEAQKVVLPATLSYRPEIPVVEVEEACELLFGGLPGVAPVGAALPAGEEADGNQAFPDRSAPPLASMLARSPVAAIRATTSVMPRTKKTSENAAASRA
jgi:hypothetical protein